MVRTAFLLLALFLGASLSAQSFSPSDTVTEYSMKGTMYHNKFEGRKTAHGDIFDHNLFTAAHHKFKFGTLLLVTNRNTGLTIIVKVNDRCPKKGVLDMTRRAAWGIGIKGCQPVKVRVLPPSYEDQWAAQGDLYDSVPSTLVKGKYAITNKNKKILPPTPQQKQETSIGKVEKAEKVEKEEKELKKAPVKSSLTDTKTESNPSAELYNLWLGTVTSHGEAFDMISKLPEAYREKAIVDNTLADEQLDILLELKLTKKKAQAVVRTLKRTFPKCKIVPLE